MTDARSGGVFAMRAAGLVVASGLLVLAGSAVYYMLAIETTASGSGVTSAALAWRNGQPLYQAMDAPGQYSLLYGPLLYAYVRLWAFLVPDPLLAGKLGAAVALALGIAAIYSPARARLDANGAFCIAGFAAIFLLSFRSLPLDARADAPLFALVALSMAAVRGKGERDQRPLLAGAAIGLLIGLSMGFKLNAIVNFAPALALLWRSHGAVGSLAVAVGTAALGLAAPFVLFDGVSAPLYAEWLRQASRHPLMLALGVHSVIWLGVLLLPLVATLAVDANRRAWLRRERLVLAGFALSATATLAFSSKYGAGRHHLIPLIPVAGWLWTSALASPERSVSVRQNRLHLLLLAGSLCFYLALCAPKMIGFLLALDPATARSARSELFIVMERERGRSIALGYAEPPAPSYLRVYPVAAGHPYLIDEMTLMDTSLTGIGVNDETLARIERCAIDVWIQHAGFEPFVRSNNYDPDENVFGDRLPLAFQSSYRLDYTTEHFTVWRCASSR